MSEISDANKQMTIASKIKMRRNEMKTNVLTEILCCVFLGFVFPSFSRWHFLLYFQMIQKCYEEWHERNEMDERNFDFAKGRNENEWKKKKQFCYKEIVFGFYQRQQSKLNQWQLKQKQKRKKIRTKLKLKWVKRRNANNHERTQQTLTRT